MMGFRDVTWLADDLAGVYLLYWSDELLYVGKSLHIASRVRTHKESKIIHFNRVLIQLCGRKKMDALEYKLITQFKPPYNKAGVKDPYVEVPADFDLEALGLIPKVQAPKFKFLQ